MTAPVTAQNAQLRRRKKRAAALSLTGAGFGIAAVGSRGAEGVLRAKKMTTAADKLSGHTSNALVLGTGVGAAGAINSAAINRQEANSRKLAKSALTATRHINSSVKNPMPKTKAVSTQPQAKQSVKGSLNMITRNQGPDPAVFAPKMPGGKKLDQLSGTVIAKGFVSGARGGFKMAGSTRPATRAAARRGNATATAGRKAGAAAHDFKAGYSRYVHATEDVTAGKTTSRETAVYPGFHKAGNVSRKLTPVAALGGAAYGGHKIGNRAQRKKQTVSKNQGVLVPISKRNAYNSEYDRHQRLGGYAAGLGAGAAGAAGYAAHQGNKARGSVKVNRSAANAKVPGKLTSLSVKRAGVVHGGRAAGALVAAGGLALGAKKVRNKSQSHGDWY